MKRSLKSSIKSLNILGILLAFLVLCVIMAIASRPFLKQTNLLNILQQISINFTIAIGMNLLLIPTGPQRMVTGSIIVIAVIVDVLRKKANSKSK